MNPRVHGSMQEKKHDAIKMEIRSVLLTYPRGVTLEEFVKTYKELLGQRLPSRALGFSTDVAFLQSMPDVVNVCTDASGKIQLTGVADEKSQHIQNLVSKQRITKPNKQSCKRQPTHRPPSNKVFNVKDQKPYLPGPLRAEILQLMAPYQNGVSCSAFVLAYRKKFNKYLPLVRGFDTLEEMIKLMPQLEIKTINKEKRIYCSLQNDSTSKKGSPSSVSPVNGLQTENYFTIDKSGISNDDIRSFQQILQKCPDGILDIHFPPLYENFTGRSFDLHEFGYTSILDLLDSLPHVFKRVLNDQDKNRWLIFPADASAKSLTVDDSSVNSPRKESSPKAAGIPADASAPALQYIQPVIPEGVDLTKYVPIFVSAIVNPSLFWFQFQTDEAVKNFEQLEKEMGNFYDSLSHKYKMHDVDVVIGASCVILCPDDKQWYRAVIKSIPSINSVNVAFVDYGSSENVPKDNLFYIRSKYHDHPACAFKAQLAGVKPPQNASVWCHEARQKFTHLCSCGILMANLKSVNKGVYSVYLCDTNGDTDIHLNDVLLSENLAEFAPENELEENSNSLEKSPGEIAICNEVKHESSSELSSRSDEDMLQLDKNDSVSESETLPLNRRLTFTPKEILCNTIAPNTFSQGKRQHSRRFLKQLQLCEETKMHFINFESKLYMTCADISKLIWSDKNSNFLIERLKYKEVDVPFLKLSKENHAELFNQCIWYKIPEFETLELDNASLIVCPLEWTLNILNVFGHPYVCFRLAIQDEIRRFDPCDSMWKEFSYEDLTDMEKEIEQKISKLCLYDLRAKNEALKIKRLKLLRMGNDPENEEIKMVEMHQKVIGKKMKEIEAICSKYSNCP